MKTKNCIIRTVGAVCAAVMFFTACLTSCSGKKSDKKVNSSAASSKTASKAASSAASDAASSTESTDSVKYFDVKGAGANGDGKSDCTKYFPKDAEGYLINDGVYAVDAETIVRLTTMPVKGNGSVKYKNFTVYFKGRFTSTEMDGVIPVSKLHDPIYTSMNLPHEAENFTENYVNALNMNAASDDFKYVNAMGGVCLNKGAKVPDNAQFTICFGKAQMAVKLKNKDWFLAQDEAYPKYANNMYDLPWAAGEAHRDVIPESKIARFDDHIEVSVTGAQFNHGVGIGSEQALLHFWNSRWEIEGGGANLEGVAVAFTIWIKEPEYANQFNMAPSADFYGDVRSGQVYEGRNYVIGSQPRVMVGHNVGNADYDRIMDSAKVQQLFGISG